MKNDKNILIGFILNFAFSIFEFWGGFFSGSFAIMSDALHDAGDAISIGLSYFLEKKSYRTPDEKYTYGYVRFSLIGSVITSTILLSGSVFVILNSVKRIFSPTPINHNGMIIFAIVGVFANSFALFFTKNGKSFNQKAINLHMLEDTLGWIIVLFGGIIIRFTGIYIFDPIMSISVSLFIFVSSVKILKETLEIFLEKIPRGIYLSEIRNCIKNIDGVFDVHHIHIWTINGTENYATMHIVTNSDFYVIKEKVRNVLCDLGISHSVLELEGEHEFCHDKQCHIDFKPCLHHHH